MPIEYKKVAGFVSIGLILLELGISALVYFVIPHNLYYLCAILLLVGGYLGTTAALWPVFFSMPDEYGDQITGFRRFLLLVATIVLIGVAIVGMMLPAMYIDKQEIGETIAVWGIILEVAVAVGPLFGIIGLFFLEGNKVQFYHKFFDFIPHHTILLALWVAPIITMVLSLLSWIIGWGHSFFVKTLKLWEIIIFFVCLACLIAGIILYFKPMADTELDKDLKIISVALLYLASCFPGIIGVDLRNLEENDFQWVLLTIIPMMIATFVAAVVANTELFPGQALLVANTLSGAWCFGAIAGLATVMSKNIRKWPTILRILSSVFLAPLWAIVTLIYMGIDNLRNGR